MSTFCVRFDPPKRTSRASFTLARILFPQCFAIWRAKSCHFSDTKSVKTARSRIVCAMSCHLSRISYELFTRYVTPSASMSDRQNAVMVAFFLQGTPSFVIYSCEVVTSHDTLENNLWTFQNFRHDMARTTSPDPHRHASPRTLWGVFASLACQIAWCGVNRLSCQCEACLRNCRKFARITEFSSWTGQVEYHLPIAHLSIIEYSSHHSRPVLSCTSRLQS